MVDYNPDLVRVGVTGTVYVGPLGTTLPTDVTTALDAAFQSVGFISEDALTESYSVETEVLRAWQRPAGIRVLTTGVEWTFQFAMLETSPLALELFYGDAESSVETGVATTAISATPQNVNRAMVVEVVDGDVITRYAIPSATIGDREEINHTNAEGTMYGVTVTVLGSDLDDLGYRLTNDPGFVELAS